MKKFYAPAALAVLLLSAFITKPVSPLQKCHELLVKPLQEKYLALTYTEKLNELEHSMEPWQQTAFSAKGSAWINAENFVKSDSLHAGRRAYGSKTEYSKTTMLQLDYGDETLLDVTPKMHEEFVFQSARYSPALLINYFLSNESKAEKKSDKLHTVYQLKIQQTFVTLFIRTADQLPEKITLLSYDEMFGDVITTFHYSQYVQAGGVQYAQSVRIEKINGKIIDEVTITSASVAQQADDLLSMPEGYHLKEEKAKPAESARTVKHNDYIYFVELAGANDRTMIVEFRDFLFMAEAPLNSANGELIISEARKIAPGKPIRYFAFGHYHPHYLGGVRPFVHKGATVISTAADIPFVQYLAGAPHTLQPDSLQLQPKPLKTETIENKMIISDGDYTMEIYMIGEKSTHTKDYLLYYFPAEKLLFEDDLGGLPESGEAPKAGKRQNALYTSIVDLHLDVVDIVQGWPIGGYGIKTKFTFAELERSAK
jgi:hypothetical protein